MLSRTRRAKPLQMGIIVATTPVLESTDEQARQDYHPGHQPALARDAALDPREDLRRPRAGERVAEDVHAGDEDDGLGLFPRTPRAGRAPARTTPPRQGHQVVPHHLGHEEHEGESQQGQDDEDGVDQGIALRLGDRVRARQGVC